MKIAIVRLSALGDIILSMIVLQFTRKQYPHAIIDWITDDAFSDILKNNSDINEVIPIRLKELKKRKSIKLLYSEFLKMSFLKGYDCIIDLQGLIKSAIVSRIIGSQTHGFDRKSSREKLSSLFYKRGYSIPYHFNTVARNCDLVAGSLNFSISPDEIVEKKPFLGYRIDHFEFQEMISSNKKNICFILGATWGSRIYDKEKLCHVIDELKQNSLLLWGNEEEKKCAEWIAATSPDAKVLPRLDLNALKALIAQMDLIIGNDTGPTHMAWALNRPSITLFGCTPISRVSHTPINKVLHSFSKVDHYHLDKNDFSINTIKTEDILSQANELLYSIQPPAKTESLS